MEAWKYGKHLSLRTKRYAVGLNPQKWENLSTIGAIHTEFEKNGKKSSEWHYYISSAALTAENLLKHARLEWAVESMHWMLDVHFER